jgi:uncharacterized protein (DUF1330 family)
MSAYFIMHTRIREEDKLKEYRSKAFQTMDGYNCEMLIFDENSHVIEGETDYIRTIVFKFDSRDNLMTWYNSPEYQEALPLRLEATEGFTVVVDDINLSEQ